MYTPTVPRIRDRQAPYGPHEIDDEAFPAARVLDDLTRCADAHVPAILARYAALRSWLLRDAGAAPELTDHADLNAGAYLAATKDGPERRLLSRLAEPEPPLDSVRAAALAARASGHREGAYALLRAGYLAARRRGELPWAARFAAAIADLLEAEGLDGAPLWARRAERARRRSRRD